MKTMVTLTHEEAQSYLAYALICETMQGAFWNSGRRRRLYSKTFTEAEQRQIPRIKATAHKWCLVTGVPEKVRMRYSTYLLWQKLPIWVAVFCCGFMRTAYNQKCTIDNSYRKGTLPFAHLTMRFRRTSHLGGSPFCV